MAQPVNRFKADLREIKFLLFEQFGLDDLFGKEPYEDWSREDAEMILDEVYKWCCEVIGPLNAVGDQQKCRLEDGKVKAPEGFKAAWKSLYENGWSLIAVDEEHGGQGGPYTMHAVYDELASGANVSFSMYPGLTAGVAEVLEAFGTDAQKKKYLPGLYNGKFAGTMCLTEPQAGSDVGAATTKAEGLGDGMYKIEGTKLFISAGDHDLSENILHLVLARTPDAPAGTKGLSLFIVPRDKLDGSGSNDVKVGSIEHKMGINGSSTALLNFGEDGACVGELVGTEELQGIKQMFRMMNLARIGVGLQSIGVASTAYLNALEYAKERKQGSAIQNWKDADAPKVEIIQHADVRRMLLDMKARVEGIRALAVKLSMHTDRERVLRGKDDDAANYHAGQVDLLVPLIKAYGSDQSFQICATAIQVFGGAGYVADHPVEQYCRDSKIFSIYEGTNHIQALDLCGRKLGAKGGMNFQRFMGDLNTFVGEIREHPVLGDAAKTLGSAAEALMGTAMRFLGWFQGGQMEMVPLSANKFLEMMAETCTAWMLLQAAAIAHEKGFDLDDDHPDKIFYEGKKQAALYYARNVLPDVALKGEILSREDKSPLQIGDASFSTV